MTGVCIIQQTVVAWPDDANELPMQMPAEVP
jgi:hypothetical protein